MPSISASVGRGGANRRADVVTIQKLLNQQNLTPLRLLEVDGASGPATIRAIEFFQEKVVGMRKPDGRVDPGGRTLRALHSNAGTTGGGPREAPSGRVAAGNLSGAAWWRANQGRYPNSRRIDDLEGDFREDVRRFVDALVAAHATVTISSTRRNPTRAHLMHYSWKVAEGRIPPGEVPAVAGLDIQWDHGNDADSRRGARQMVELFNMAHIASLTSNHIRGTAIDMTIAWKDELSVVAPGRTDPTVISDGPRNGADNRALHDVGRLFGVLKLRTDPPHWSHNGH